ncbi:hypothetical protein H9P43_004919 [Blastocladiella emersonii ATCC 22665]|nr:hypothetical protein H9P43_004919 [Blastocladiella emersonii ATCC 22665]
MGNQQSGEQQAVSIDVGALPRLSPREADEYRAKFQFTEAEILYAQYAHAQVLATATSGNSWIAQRALSILFQSQTITLPQYLRMIQWWHSSPHTVKLQYVFNFLDVDGDEFVTINDLLVVLPRLLGTKIAVGDQVVIKSTGTFGTVQYAGEVPERGKGSDWLGVQLPIPGGTCDGSIKTKRYFSCPAKHGTFLRAEKVELRSTYDWISSVFQAVLGQPLLISNGTDGITAVKGAPSRISWEDFAHATLSDPGILHRLVRWFFPLPLRQGEPVPASMVAPRAMSPGPGARPPLPQPRRYNSSATGPAWSPYSSRPLAPPTPAGTMTIPAYTNELVEHFVTSLEHLASFAMTSMSDPDLVAEDLLELRTSYAAMDRGAKQELWERDLSVRTVAKVSRLISVQPWGLQFLITVRGDMLQHMHSRATTTPPSMQTAVTVLKRQIQTSLLRDLRFVTVERSASLIQYETVHPLRTLDDLDRRLQAQRLIYAFTHPQLADPIAFLQVALTTTIPGSVQSLLQDPTAGDPAGRAAATTATFYSVNSTMRGLSGIDVGSRIIKRGVAELQETVPNVHTFTTLSPIPSFRAWIAATGWKSAEVQQCVPAPIRGSVKRTFGDFGVFGAMVDRGKWIHDAAQCRFVGSVLTPICKHYLLATHKDPVARFHLGNGAVAYQLNWMGDVSPKGMAQSFTFMVNYLYPLADLEANARAYRSQKLVQSRL